MRLRAAVPESCRDLHGRCRTLCTAFRPSSRAVPLSAGGVAAVNEQPILDVRGLSTDYTVKRQGKTFQVHAVKDVSFTLARGEVLGIVGESGCGKTSVGRSIVRLAKPHRGEVLFGGKNIFTVTPDELRKLRLKIRMVFQD